MKNKLLRLAAVLALLTVGITANAAVWLSGNLGSPAYSGSIVTNAEGTLTIQAGGNDIWGNSDNGYYYYTWISGNFDARINVQTMTPSGTFSDTTWIKCEMMARQSDSTAGVQGNDPFIASMCAPNQNGTANGHQYRATRGGGANNNMTNAVAMPGNLPNNWVRLTRTNSVFVMLASSNNVDWVTLATVDTANTASFGFSAWPDAIVIGVAVTAHDNNNDGTNNVVATFTTPQVSTSGSLWTPPTSGSITRDVVNVPSTYLGSEASFKFRASNNGSPVPFPMSYQWYKNGVLATGATGTAYTWLAAAGDAGTQLQCVGWPTLYPSVTITSAVGTLSAVSSATVTGNGLKEEIFAGAYSRADVYNNNTTSGDTGNGAITGKLRWVGGAFQDGGGYGDNTSRRYTGWFQPPADGNYTFYVAADDDTDVSVSTDSTAANLRPVCQEPQWSGFNNWTNAGGGGTNAISQKCSDTWTNGVDVDPPYASGIPLLAANRYYIQVVEHNGGGGDNCSVTLQPTGDIAPTNGSASLMTSISLITWQPTTFTWSVFPTNLLVSESSAANFFVTATSDGEFAPHYQWQTYGTNVPGATSSSYSINPTTFANNNTPVRCIATIPVLGSITSQVGILTISTAVFEPGFVKEEKWTQLGGNSGNGYIANVIAGTMSGPPDYVAALPAAEASVNGETGDNYVRKISGFVIPATTGTYDFWINSDDNSTLLLSTDSNPVNKRTICQQPNWSGTYDWNNVGSDANNPATPAQKCSATWTNDTGSPFASGISLSANVKYYFEAVHGEGGGGDNVEVAMVPHGSALSANVDYSPTGNLIGINAPKCTWVAFTLQPTNPPAVSASATDSVSFYAFGTTDSQFPVGSINANGPNNTEVASQFVFFQWYKNSTAIPGATASSYTQTGIRGTDNGAQFKCQMRALGYGLAPSTHYWSNSAIATVSVTNLDPTVPSIVYSGFYTGTEQFSPPNYISLTFSIRMDPNTLTNPANYSIPGINVLSVTTSPDGRHVQLSVDILPSGTPTITITGVKTWSGVGLAPGSNTVQTHEALPSNLTFQDIGQGNATGDIVDPVFPSRLYLDGPGVLTIAAEGNDIWGQYDGFNFIYETKSGDFDVVLRQTAYSLGDRWAKVGLMARENIDTIFSVGQFAGGSRNWNVVNDPPNLPCLADGNGANNVEANWRTNNNSTGITNFSAGWPGAVGQAPAYPNAWVRLKRQGSVLTAFAGNNGLDWTQLAQMDPTTNGSPALPSDLKVGICVTGHHNDAVNANPPLYFNYATVDSYNSHYVAPPPHPVVTVTLSGANVIASWTPTGSGTLQSSTDLVTWTDVGSANPSPPIPASGGAKFFRVRVAYTP